MKYVLRSLCLFLLLGLGTLALAQETERKEGGSATIQQKGGEGVDIRIQGQRGDQPSEGARDKTGPQGPSGVPGPQGTPGPQGPAGPSGGTTVLGMDPTIALIIGLGVLAVVIVAIVAASRSGHEAR